MRELRKITYRSYLDVNGAQYLKNPKEGLFHEFGEELVYSDEKQYSRTIAIIEDSESGQVYKVLPDYIKFENGQ